VTDIVRTPRPELVAVADLLDEAIGDFLTCRTAVRPEAEWEAPLEAWAISNLMIRNIEAAAVLARHDEVLAPAAWANARNVFDAATRILWLLTPAERFEAEARWITLLVERERFHLRMAAVLEEDGDQEASGHRHRASRVRDFHEGVAAKLPATHSVPRRPPPADQLLRELGVAGMYRLYIEGSQYMHATMAATSMYIDRDEVGRKPTESLAVIDWILPLRTCWICLYNAGWFVIDRLSPGHHWDVTQKLGTRVDAGFRELAESGFPEEWRREHARRSAPRELG
jgi:hypothetical protein